MKDVSGPGVLARTTSWLDRFLLAYYLTLLAFTLAGSGEARPLAISAITFLVLAHTTVVALVRGGALGQGKTPALLYRLVVYGGFQSSYFALRWVLPTARSVLLDAKLLRLDLALFHVEPALYFDRFVNPHTTEWFAFFYFSYFFLLGSFVLPMMFGCRDLDLVSEFATSICMLFGIAHILYIVVPGFGPWWYMAKDFQHPLPSGRFLDLVMSAVHAGGAQKDIFPSLHTAAPTLLTLFAFRHRARMPFRWAWPILAFFTGNIIIATLFLRWHYAIDVVVGLTHAVLVWHFAHIIAARENAARRAAQMSPAWAPLRSSENEHRELAGREA